MKKRPVAALSYLLVALSMYAGQVFASPIESQYRACEHNEDCSLIMLHCSCRPVCRKSDDEIDTVSKKYLEQYKYLEQCTAAETKSCSMAGPCAVIDIPSAVCQNQLCVVDWKPNTYGR